MSKVKICGLSRFEDIDAANRALPDYVGFVFAPSRRQVDVRTATKLRERLDVRIEAVGVFVNHGIDAVASLCRSGVIGLAQLHGDEDGRYIMRLKGLCGCRVIKAVAVADKSAASVAAAAVAATNPAAGVQAASSRPPGGGPDYLLFDTFSEQRGGAGQAFDWRALEGYAGLPYFLAGGLDASNVADAIALLCPYCVDVSSGVETGGVKDAAKIEEFVRTARGVRADRKGLSS